MPAAARSTTAGCTIAPASTRCGFLRDLTSAVRALRAISADEIARRKAALALHRADVLHDLRDLRAGDHFLLEVAEHFCQTCSSSWPRENGWN